MILSPRYETQEFLTIQGPNADQAVPLARQRRRLVSELAKLTDAQWLHPSRCEGWTVQDVVNHLIGVDQFWLLSLQMGLAGTPTQVLGAFDPAATPKSMVDPMRVLAPSETLEQFSAATTAFVAALEALSDEQWLAKTEAPIGHVSARIMAHHALWDAWIHERDILVPLGYETELHHDELLTALTYAAGVSPAFLATQGRAMPGTFLIAAINPTIELTVTVDLNSTAITFGTADADYPSLRGNAVELIDALTFRAPLPTSAPPQWHELVTGLGRVFDQA